MSAKCIMRPADTRRKTALSLSCALGVSQRTSRRVPERAGAKEVHVRIASPKMTHPCFYGVDTSTREELISALPAYIRRGDAVLVKASNSMRFGEISEEIKKMR